MLTFFGKKLLGDKHGLSTIEFAIGFPLIFFGIFYTSYELWQMVSAALRVDRAASHVATVAARADSTLDEGALTSLLKSANTISSPTDILTNGRVVLSAVEGGPNGKILWQRCSGGKTSYTSSLGVTGAVADLSSNGFPQPPENTTALIAETYYEHYYFLTGTSGPSMLLKHKAISLGREEIPNTVIATGTPSNC